MSTLHEMRLELERAEKAFKQDPTPRVAAAMKQIHNKIKKGKKDGKPNHQR